MTTNFVKKGAVVFSLLVANLLSSAQTRHERYVQKLDGTNLAFSMEAIPGGEFMMGSDKGQKDDEKPVHKVKLDPFWMGTYEVTWDIYEPFVYKDLEVTQSVDGKLQHVVDSATSPIEPSLNMTFSMGKVWQWALDMTHYNAIQFCIWLYTRTGVFYRLPTEEEWEYACRAGSTTEYYFGDDASL